MDAYKNTMVTHESLGLVFLEQIINLDECTVNGEEPRENTTLLLFIQLPGNLIDQSNQSNNSERGYRIPRSAVDRL